MKSNLASRCRHPGFARRMIAPLAALGESWARQLGRTGMLVQKVSNTLLFERFWQEHVAANPAVIIVPSFAKTRSKHPIWNIALEKACASSAHGKILEFGTNNGGSLLYFQQHVPDTIMLYGFDCFDGIPEPWDSLPRGAIKGHGFPSELWSNDPLLRESVAVQVARTGLIPPPPQPNIRVEKGLFAHSVPRFLSNGVPDDIRLIHFDADIYMGTRPVLDSICGQITYPYYVLFDEFYSVNHEFRAWMEFVDLFSLEDWSVIATSEDGVQVLIAVNVCAHGEVSLGVRHATND